MGEEMGKKTEEIRKREPCVQWGEDRRDKEEGEGLRVLLSVRCLQVSHASRATFFLIFFISREEREVLHVLLSKRDQQVSHAPRATAF
jgi:hypothetical protein